VPVLESSVAARRIRRAPVRPRDGFAFVSGHAFRGATKRPQDSGALAPEGNVEEDLWGIVDSFTTSTTRSIPAWKTIPTRARKILKERGWPEVIRRAIMSHARIYRGHARFADGKSSFRCDELAGFISAVA